MSTPEIIALMAATVGVAKLLELTWTRMLNRKTVKLTDDQLKIANTKSEVDVVRAVLQEVQDHSLTKDKRIDTLESTVARLEGRLERVEYREHQSNQLLAGHEEWDLRIMRAVLEIHPDWPSPPPLRVPAPMTIEEHIETVPSPEAHSDRDE